MPALKLGTSGSFVPPDINNPPFYIPLKNIDARYNVVQELGKGSFGSVTLAESLYDMNSSAQEISSMYPETLMDQSLIRNVEQENWYYKKKGIVAIKTMMNRLPTLHDYTRVREIKFILQIPAHKNLVTIYEMFIDDSLYHLHIVMECMEQNIYQLMKHRKRRVFSLPTLRSILFQILAGIKHIHDHDFFHRDIKPENILISPSHRYFSKTWLEDDNYPDNYVVKLADYGLARHVNNRSPYTTYVSTRWYRSPEILLRKGYYSKPLDMWAYGCVVVELATFSPLFPGSDETDQIWRILDLLGSPDHMVNGKQHFGGSWPDSKPLYQALNYEFPYVEGKTIRDVLPNPQLEDLYDVVTSCLKWNPNERASADDLCRLPYFREYVVKEIEMAKQSKNISHTNSLEASNSEENSMFSNKLGLNNTSTTGQWNRILSGLPHKTDLGIIPSFHAPQRISKVYAQNQENSNSDKQEQQQQKKGGVASWFKFSSQRNHVNINPNSDSTNHGNNLISSINRMNLLLHNKQQIEQKQQQQLFNQHDHGMNELHENNPANTDNEVFTIELDDSMDTMTGSERVSHEMKETAERYHNSLPEFDDQNQERNYPPSLELDDEKDSVQMDDENYRIQVLDEFDIAENLAHEIADINGEERDENKIHVTNQNTADLNETDENEDDPDSLLSYYHDMISKKIPQDKDHKNSNYIHSNGLTSMLSNTMSVANAGNEMHDLQEQIPRNLLENTEEHKVLDSLLDPSASKANAGTGAGAGTKTGQNPSHTSQSPTHYSHANSHNHPFQEGLSF